MRKLICIAIALVPLLVAVPACTTANKAAYKTVQVTSATADLGLRVWADYVAQQKAIGTPVPLEQEVQAKKAWNAFQDARDGVIKAGVAYSHQKAANADLTGAEAELNAAVAAMAAAQADFITMLQGFGVKVQ